MRRIFLFAGLLLALHVDAQQVRPANSATVYNEIAQLQNLTSVLYFAAHPDDENTRLLAWLVNDQHIPTAYLSLTRGDGGQNILGSEQGGALGLIRTHELLAARQMDGATQYFTRAIDFGFSKNPEETFKHWDEYLLTNDAVRVIRRFRPDVIICRFPPDSRAGHGQHSASAIIAAKAFKMAGDKLQFTEHFQYNPAWQAKRLLWNTYRFGRSNTTSEDQFKIKVGNYSPLLGMGYGELAGISRSLHRSQGAGTPSVAGVQQEYFALVAGDSMTNSLFDGIDITWNRVGRPEIGEAIKEILAHYDFNNPAASLPALLDLRKDIKTVKSKHWRTEKLKELDQAILSASGLMAEATTTLPQAVAGQTVPYSLRIISRSGGLPVSIKTNSYADGDSALLLKNMVEDSLYVSDRTYTISKDQPLTQPYWLINPPLNDLWSVPADSLIGLPETPNTLNVMVRVKIGGESFNLPVPLSYKKLDPLKGDVVEQLRIVPPITIEPYAYLLLTQPDGSVRSSVRVHAYGDVNNATLTFFGNNKKISSLPAFSLKANSDTIIPFVITSTQAAKLDNEYVLTMEISDGNKVYDKTLHLIQYEHVPTLQYFTPSAGKVLRNDWKVTAKKIGFIEGAGDYTVTFLRLAGLQVDILKDAELSDPSKLKGYDAIVTGVRAVNVENRMSYWLPSLLQYVKNGGTLVMQYNNLQTLSTTHIGPYPFTLTSKRVTEEDAPVTVLSPQARILNYPNKIKESDFQGWVQERGLYFADPWDAHYQTIFSMHDTGEQPLEGSTLYTDYGKGHYIYTSLSFFRQLPAGNKGAIRLFMNMLSAGK
jgi:LmbE family N-acetylglucosaminyl deacetylase